MVEISVNVNCPTCGGAIRIEEGSKTTNCPYCDSLLWFEGEEGVNTIMFRNMFDSNATNNIVKQWFSKGLKARNLKTLGRITEAYPIYLPYWKMTVRAAGWVCGYREVTKTDRQGRTSREKEYLERMVFQDFPWSKIACDPGDIGISALKNLVGEVVFHEEGIIPTFEATTSRTDAIEEGKNTVRQTAINSAGIPHITYQNMHVFPRNVSLIYYPVWIVRYKYNERTYFVTIDGVTGKSLSGRAPGDPLYQSLIMTAGTSIGGILAGLGFAFASENNIAIGAIIAGIIVFGLSYLFFRHGSEITEGDIVAGYKKFKFTQVTPPLKSTQVDVGRLAEQFFRRR